MRVHVGNTSPGLRVVSTYRVETRAGVLEYSNVGAILTIHCMSLSSE